MGVPADAFESWWGSLDQKRLKNLCCRIEEDSYFAVTTKQPRKAILPLRLPRE